MKKTFFYFTVTVFIVATTSCRNSTEPVTANDDPVGYAEIEKADWLIGKWHHISPEGEVVEIWEKENDSTYNGVSYFIVLYDTIFYETIAIQQRGNDLSYISTVNDQNDAETVTFKLRSATDEAITFENKLNDFPKRITYTRVGSDSLVTIISGRIEGKHSVQEFPMERMGILFP